MPMIGAGGHNNPSSTIVTGITAPNIVGMPLASNQYAHQGPKSSRVGVITGPSAGQSRY